MAHAEHILGGGAVAVLCAAGTAHAGPGSFCVSHQPSAQPVVKGEVGKAGNGGHLVCVHKACTNSIVTTADEDSSSWHLV